MQDNKLLLRVILDPKTTEEVTKQIKSIFDKLNRLNIGNLIDQKSINNTTDSLSELSKGLSSVADKIAILLSLPADIGSLLGSGKSKERFCPLW